MNVFVDSQNIVQAYGVLDAVPSGLRAYTISDDESYKLSMDGVKQLAANGTINVYVDPAIAQNKENADRESGELRGQLASLAQSAVGVRLDALTTSQLRALLACLLRKVGGVRKDMTVAPLEDWLN